MQPRLIGNEALLMLIGTAIGVLLNLFLPRNIAAIQAEQTRVENILRAFFLHMTNALRGEDCKDALQDDLAALQNALSGARRQATALSNNTLFGDMAYYTQYVDMRRNQYIILRRIADAASDLPGLAPAAGRLSAFMWQIAQALHEHNDGTLLLTELSQMREGFRQSPLPQTRGEFETRAILYRIMIDTEHFLLLKKSFADSLTSAEKKAFQPPAGTPSA